MLRWPRPSYVLLDARFSRLVTRFVTVLVQIMRNPEVSSSMQNASYIYDSKACNVFLVVSNDSELTMTEEEKLVETSGDPNVD